MAIGKINRYMVQLIRSDQVKVVTENNEVKISLVLDLNINLNSGTIEVSSNLEGNDRDMLTNEEDEKTEWIIPEFTSTKEKINFGKKEMFKNES